MKKLSFKKSCALIMTLLGLISFTSMNAQALNLTFSWDKLGCQVDGGSTVSLDSISQNNCLKVCRNSTVTYVISGEDLEFIGDVEWSVEGGEAMTHNGLSVPVKWDESTNGLLKFRVILKTNDTIDKTICILKDIPELILGWDKVGCQSDKDHVNEMKFNNNLSNSNCLLVCKSSKSTYKIFGETESNIDKIHWYVTGGVAYQDDALSTLIEWGNSNSGSIRIYVKLIDGTIIDETICVYIVNSSLMLQWEKIDESPVSEIKYDTTPDDTDTILMYPDTVSIYKIGGDNATLISTIFWEVTGGYAYNSHSLSTPITWYDEEEVNTLVLNVVYNDSTEVKREIKIINMLRAQPGGNPQANNAINFLYDLSGNQTKREMIFLAAKNSNSLSDSNVISKKNNEKKMSISEYSDITYYPNPVRSELYLKWENSKNTSVVKIELYNNGGQFVNRIPIAQGSKDAAINFESYPTGVYMLTLIYGNGEKKTLTIVKQ